MVLNNADTAMKSNETSREERKQYRKNCALKQMEKELEKGGEIPEKLTQRTTGLPKLIRVMEF